MLSMLHCTGSPTESSKPPFLIRLTPAGCSAGGHAEGLAVTVVVLGSCVTVSVIVLGSCVTVSVIVLAGSAVTDVIISVTVDSPEQLDWEALEQEADIVVAMDGQKLGYFVTVSVAGGPDCVCVRVIVLVIVALIPLKVTVMVLLPPYADFVVVYVLVTVDFGIVMEVVLVTVEVRPENVIEEVFVTVQVVLYVEVRVLDHFVVLGG